MIKDYKSRVIEEKANLDNKLRSLITFMHGDEYASLVAVEQGLFMVQLVAMDNYSDALGRRIELF